MKYMYICIMCIVSSLRFVVATWLFIVFSGFRHWYCANYTFRLEGYGSNWTTPKQTNGQNHEICAYFFGCAVILFVLASDGHKSIQYINYENRKIPICSDTSLFDALPRRSRVMATQIIGNSTVYWIVCSEYPNKKGHWQAKCFHIMTLSCKLAVCISSIHRCRQGLRVGNYISLHKIGCCSSGNLKSLGIFKDKVWNDLNMRLISSQRHVMARWRRFPYFLDTSLSLKFISHVRIRKGHRRVNHTPAPTPPQIYQFISYALYIMMCLMKSQNSIPNVVQHIPRSVLVSINFATHLTKC